MTRSSNAGSAAAFVHGIAGRIAGDRRGDGATAVDVLAAVPAAMLEVVAV